MSISNIVSTVKTAIDEVDTISSELQNLLFGMKDNYEMTIDDISNLDRPATTFRWQCFMPNKLLDYGKNNGIYLGDIPKEYVSSINITLPFFSSINTNGIVYSKTKYLGSKRPDLGTLNVEFYEDENYRILQYFQKWDNACFSKKGTFKPLKAKVGVIKFVAFTIESNNPTLAALFYVIPTSNINLKYNGESEMQKPKVDFKILYYAVTSYNEASKNEKSINDLFSSINKFF